jgi:peptidoglycan LD-endopeptidase LytH
MLRRLLDRAGHLGRPGWLVVALLVVLVGCVPPGNTGGYRYVVPVQAGVQIGYGGVGSHHDYPAADVFASSGCGTTLVSPVDGRVLELRDVDLYVRALDNPAYRGGRYVSILGRDGVRYYLAHLAAVAPGLRVGQAVTAGQPVGTLGESGDAGACHVHFGLSPVCAKTGDWWTRRGTIYPWPYLDAWRAHKAKSPVAELSAWKAQHGCPTKPTVDA